MKLRTAMIGALWALLGLSGTAAGTDLQLVMPICDMRDERYGLLDPPYRGSANLSVPASILLTRPGAAEWPASAGKPPQGYVEWLLLKDPEERFFQLHFTNIAASISAKLELLTFASTRKYVVGDDAALPRMASNIVPPFRRREQPEAGMWVWEMPDRWINADGQVRSSTEATFSRVFQPVGREDEAVIRCEYARYSTGLVGPCRVHTQLMLHEKHRCATVAVDYGIYADQIERWAETDSYVKSRLRQLVVRVSVSERR